MSKRAAPASTKKPTAAEIIASACSEHRDMPPDDALEQLDLLFKHNKSRRPRQTGWVPAEKARELLAGYGWERGRGKFDALVKGLYGVTWGR